MESAICREVCTPKVRRRFDAALAGRLGLGAPDRQRTRSDPRRAYPDCAAIERAAAELSVSSRQVYNLLARYRADRRVSSLLPHRNGARKKRLDAGVEDIIAATLRAQWLANGRPRRSRRVVAEIRARCEEAGQAAPSDPAVERRIPVLFTPEEIARKCSANPKHLLRLRRRGPDISTLPSRWKVRQIDHTPTDIHFVEVVEGEGVFVGRAYLTLLADAATRCILGFSRLTLEKPSALSVALCLAQAMCPKDKWLAARGVGHPWPMFGRPRLLVTDSAKEFKGHAFQRGCEDYGIRIRYRDRGRVHEGGVVERLSGN